VPQRRGLTVQVRGDAPQLGFADPVHMISRWNSSALGVSTTGPVMNVPVPHFAAVERTRPQVANGAAGRSPSAEEDGVLEVGRSERRAADEDPFPSVLTGSSGAPTASMKPYLFCFTPSSFATWRVTR